MYKKATLITIVVLALTTIACGITVNLPNVDRIETGPLVTDDIKVPLPDTSGTVELEIAFGAGELNINPGASGNLVEGTAKYNVEKFKPNYTINGRQVKLQQGEGKLTFDGIPSFDENVRNTWDIELADVPMELTINAGATQTEIELGGLSLEALTVSQGASDFELGFSEPNQTSMSEFRFNAGASSARLTGLANSRAEEITFRGGAGSYTLEFTGELEEDIYVSIEAGVGSVTVIVPEGVAAEASLDGALANVDYSGDWERSGGNYETSGSGPRITIKATMAAGELQLQSR